MAELIDNAVVPVSVTVEPDGTIKCFPNPVPVNGISTLITYRLDTPGFRFRTFRAIELDKPNSDFPFPSWTVTPTLATLYDLCDQIDVFKYTVHVINTISDVALSIDPEIRNGDTGTGKAKGKGKSKAKSKR